MGAGPTKLVQAKELLAKYGLEDITPPVTAAEIHTKLMEKAQESRKKRKQPGQDETKKPDDQWEMVMENGNITYKNANTSKSSNVANATLVANDFAAELSKQCVEELAGFKCDSAEDMVLPKEEAEQKTKSSTNGAEQLADALIAKYVQAWDNTDGAKEAFKIDVHRKREGEVLLHFDATGVTALDNNAVALMTALTHASIWPKEMCQAQGLAMTICALEQARSALAKSQKVIFTFADYFKVSSAFNKKSKTVRVTYFLLAFSSLHSSNDALFSCWCRHENTFKVKSTTITFEITPKLTQEDAEQMRKDLKMPSNNMFSDEED